MNGIIRRCRHVMMVLSSSPSWLASSAVLSKQPLLRHFGLRIFIARLPNTTILQESQRNSCIFFVDSCRLCKIKQMRHSLQKHNVARLRVIIGENQEVFAKLIGCSVHTLQSVETGRFKLSEELARRISAATDVDLDWLRQNDLTAEPKVANSKFPYTRSTFENAQAQRHLGTPDFIATIAPDYLLGSYGQLRAIISSAGKRGEGGVVIWKLGRFIDDLRKDYGHNNAVAPIAEFRLRKDSSPVLTFGVRDAGMRLAKQDIAGFDQVTAELERELQANASESKRRREPRLAKAKQRKPRKRQRTGNRRKRT
jgi:DNA-binding XRE family transcriptional regulator